MTSSDDQRLLDYFSWNSCVSDDRKLFYVATPKVACTSLKWWFAELEGVAEAVQQDKTSSETDPELAIHDTLLSVAPQLFVRSPERLAQIKADGYFSFALVRNPYKRVFSAWQSKILLREPLQIVPYQGQDFVEYPIELMSDVTGAFECFLEYLYAHERHGFKDCHWTPQYDLLQPALFPYSVVSKIEDTTALDAALRVHLADAYVSPFTTARANESMIPYLPEFITPRSKELIEDLYSKDFEVYGYSTELPPAKEKFSQEHLALALKAIELLRGRHLRMGEMRQNRSAELSTLLKDKEWLADQRDTWMAVCKEKETELVSLQGYCAGEVQKLEMKETELVSLQGYCAGEVQKLEMARVELEQLKSELAQSNAALAHSNSELQRSNAELAKRNAEGVRLEAELAETESDVGRLKAELVKVTSNWVQLKSDLAQSNSGLAQSNSELAQLKTELAHSTTELAQSGSDLAQSNSELAKSNSELSRSNTDLAQANARLEWSRAELEKIKQNVASLISEREAFALKHKRYLSVYRFVEAGFVNRLRKAGQLLKGRKGE